MMPDESIRKIVVDSSGRITALPDGASVSSMPLKVGDRLLIDRVRSSGRRGSLKKESQKVERGVRVRKSRRRVWGHLKLRNHAIETFGSEKAAEEWLTSECGALNNQTPLDFIRMTGNHAEVERILGCIDYGMIA
jgi:uncharacterized protein (DUF2384 family)